MPLSLEGECVMVGAVMSKPSRLAGLAGVCCSASACARTILVLLGFVPVVLVIVGCVLLVTVALFPDVLCVVRCVVVLVSQKTTESELVCAHTTEFVDTNRQRLANNAIQRRSNSLVVFCITISHLVALPFDFLSTIISCDDTQVVGLPCISRKRCASVFGS